VASTVKHLTARKIIAATSNTKYRYGTTQ